MREPVKIRVCEICGRLEPSELWGGAKIVAGTTCAHRAWRTLVLRREDDGELTDLIADVLQRNIALGDEDYEPAPRSQYQEVAACVVRVLRDPSQRDTDGQS